MTSGHSNTKRIDEAGAMGCSSSAVTQNQTRQCDRVTSDAVELSKIPAFLTAIKAAILIQRWYRRHVARMEMRQRYTWSIFQSIEYAGEQDQLQLSHFFTFLMDHHARHRAQLSVASNGLLSQLLNPLGDACDSAEYDPVPEDLNCKIPSYYSGPRLSFPLTAFDASALLKAFKQRKQLHSLYVLQLLQETKKVVKQMPNITHLSTSYSKDITVCGDLHGKLDDLLLIFYKNGLPMPEKPYIFNGDFVDRGENSIEVIIILFAFLLIYPNDVHLNRGNHEDYIMNIRYGFQKEVLRKYKSQGKRILQLVQDVFRWLPLATVIDSKVLVVHGGISDSTDLDFLASVPRQRFKSLLRLHRSPSKYEELCQKKPNLEGHPSKILNSDGNVCGPRLSDQDCKTQTFGSSPPSSPHSIFSCTQPHLSEGYRSPSDSKFQYDPTLDLNKYVVTQNVECNGTDILHVSHPDCEKGLRKVLLREELEWKQIVDVLWSDPRSQTGCIPNTMRGGGCYFGEDITEKMLKKYNLKLIIRSHECKQNGYEACHNGKVITIFSASNYYEEGSNQGAYIKLGPDLTPHFVKYRVSKATRKLTLKQRVSVIEESALTSLRGKLFAHKSEVISAFREYDPDCTGKIALSQWVSAVDSVLHLNVPWRTLRHRLVRTNADGSVDYFSSFESLQIEQPMKEIDFGMQVQPNLIEAMYRHRADLEIIFRMIDKDHSGMISMEEFRQTWKLFSSHLQVHMDDQSVDNLAQSIDFNSDGRIDFNEFLEAFRLVQKDKDKIVNISSKH
ncbi:serine/threonine-protein phosphatase with EF-hands 1-like isoform X3 [Narcine bancroftii]|uniref:serine/threonine-protein phosphatase with EF-hands 1-like isoform X3 n=1 Tax=Narcine bancroftii TaxID=1343680 RepID=UPI0038314149